jgi:hypothetical protein
LKDLAYALFHNVVEAFVKGLESMVCVLCSWLRCRLQRRSWRSREKYWLDLSTFKTM